MATIFGVYIANAITRLASIDLIPIGQDPGGTEADGAIAYSDLIAQIKGTDIGGAKIEWVSVSAHTVHESAPFLAENGDVLEITSAIATTGLVALTASTWYHIYAYLSGANTVVETVITAPVVWKGTAYSKAGDTSRRYLGSILVDSGQDIYAFEHIGDYIAYKLHRVNAAPFRALSAGTDTSATAIPLSGAVPITASLAQLKIQNTADGVLRTSEDTNVTTTQVTVNLSAGDSATQNISIAHAMDTSFQIWYYLSAQSTGGATVDINGYYFKR